MLVHRVIRQQYLHNEQTLCAELPCRMAEVVKLACANCKATAVALDPDRESCKHVEQLLNTSGTLMPQSLVPCTAGDAHCHCDSSGYPSKEWQRP